MIKRIAVSIVLLVMISINSVHAVGALYARQPLSNFDYKPLWLTKYDVKTVITDQMSVTHVDQTFKNETNQRLEGIMLFPLPDNAIITELALWEDGVRKVGKTMESDTARAIYNGTVRKSIDPALLEYMGNNVFKLSVFPIEGSGVNSERRVEITYAELLPYEAGVCKYSFPMKTVNMSSKPVQRASVSISLSSQQTILSASSSSHNAGTGFSLTKTSDTSFSVLYGQENTWSEKDLNVEYKLKNNDYGIRALTYTPSFPSVNFYDTIGDSPYFLLWITPPDTVTMDKIMKKNIVFVADVSSSMTGTRITQVRKALNSMVDMLNSGDRFNIVSFSTAANMYKSDLVNFNTSNAATAHTFINSLGASGMTNMNEAFKAAFQNSWVDTCVNTIVFLTDGKPTWPDTNCNAVLDTVSKLNKTAKVNVTTFGIGDTATEIIPAFLKDLSKNSNGFSYLITDNNQITGTLETFMQKISHPTIKNVTIEYGSLTSQDVYPTRLPDIYAQSQLTILGRYLSPQTATISVAGTVGSKEMILSKAMSFPSKTMENQPFVPRMWASVKINYLLDQIASFGVTPELKTAVVYLGKKYNIITPYTSMLVAPETSNLTEDKTMARSAQMHLSPCMPNPFRATTMVQFAVPQMKTPQKMVVKIFDARGALVRTLVNEYSLGGNYRVSWNALDNNGRQVSPGMYIVAFSCGAVKRITTVSFLR